MMNRREALSRVALLMGSAVTAPTMIAFLDGCKTKDAATGAEFAFEPEQLNLVSEVAEVIIPQDRHARRQGRQGGRVLCRKCSKTAITRKTRRASWSACPSWKTKDFMAASAEEKTALLTAAEQESMDELKRIGEERTKAQGSGPGSSRSRVCLSSA